MDFEFHGHNDLGMATANSVAALMSGAGSVSATVNGLGERAGNAFLEEIAAALKVSAGIDCGIHLSGMQELCRFVAEASSKPIHGSKTHCRRYDLPPRIGNSLQQPPEK